MFKIGERVETRTHRYLSGERDVEGTHCVAWYTIEVHRGTIVQESHGSYLIEFDTQINEIKTMLIGEDDRHKWHEPRNIHRISILDLVAEAAL